MRPFRFFALTGPVVCAVALFAAGCGSGSGSSPTVGAVSVPTDGPVSASRSFRNLVLTVTAPKHIYAVGETVPLTFTVQNTGTTDATSAYDTSSSYLNVFYAPLPAGGTVTTKEGAFVRDLLTISPFTTGGVLDRPAILLFPAGQIRTFDLKWNQISSAAVGSTEPFTQVAPGAYRIRGDFAVSNLNGDSVTPSDLASDYIDIVVR